MSFVCEKECVMFDTWCFLSAIVTIFITNTQQFRATQCVVITTVSSLTVERELYSASRLCPSQGKMNLKHIFI